MRAYFFPSLLLAYVFLTPELLANDKNVTRTEPEVDKTKQLITAGDARLSDNQDAQITVSDTSEKTQSISKQYMEELKLLNSLNMYNNMLDRQLNNQNTEIDKLNASINNATLIERQILPLLVRMVDALENFVAIDMPFLDEERKARVQGLQDLLLVSNLTTSEKARRVFEAYQIENEYGYTIEAYKGNVQLPESKFAVEFLRIGRISLLYRDLSGSRFGFWDQQSRQWQTLEQSQYKRHITKGLKIAKEEISPELITIPHLVNAEVR